MQTGDESQHHPKAYKRACQVRGQHQQRHSVDPSLVKRLTRRRRTATQLTRLIGRLLIDQTTGLPNHYAFEQLYRDWRAEKRNFAVLLIDICGFGKYNERRGGHARGNELLANFARALRGSLKAQDLVARWSLGDEFLIAADGIDNSSKLEQLKSRLEGPFVVPWGRRRRRIRCYVVGRMARDKDLRQIEPLLHERLRQLKQLAKASGQVATNQIAEPDDGVHHTDHMMTVWPRRNGAMIDRHMLKRGKHVRT